MVQPSTVPPSRISIWRKARPVTSNRMVDSARISQLSMPTLALPTIRGGGASAMQEVFARVSAARAGRTGSAAQIAARLQIARRDIISDPPSGFAGLRQPALLRRCYAASGQPKSPGGQGVKQYPTQ